MNVQLIKNCKNLAMVHLVVTNAKTVKEQEEKIELYMYIKIWIDLNDGTIFFHFI